MNEARRSLVRIGAVGYLNARPLTWALDRDLSRWAMRYDLPAVCAALLQAGDVDLGLTPSIEYLHDPRYRFVPGIGIGSRGAVTSVAIFSTRPMADVRTIALDTSSRTSVALTRVLCHDWFKIAPAFVPQGPSLEAMTATHDAALLIGDPALEADASALGLLKVDLGEAWLAMTGLPFVFAAWTGRAGALSQDDVRALQAARDEGLANIEAIAAEYAPHDAARQTRAAAYLRDNVRYGLGPEEVAGLRLFLDRAAALGLAPRRDLEFF
jgi:chorismate dehydratase